MTITPASEKTTPSGASPRPIAVEGSADLGELLKLLRLEGVRHRAALARRLGLSLNESLALEYLQRYGPRTTGDLAGLLLLSSSAVTQISKHLERIGHLVRGPHPVDRRKTLFSPTPAAIGAASEELRVFVAEMIAVHAARSSQERRILTGFVDAALMVTERAADAMAWSSPAGARHPQARELGALLHLLQLAGMRHGAALARRLGWTPTAALAVEYLQRYGPKSTGELAALLWVSPSAVAQMTKDLERRGHLARHAHPVDRRKALFVPTPVAVDAVRAERAPFARDLAAVDAALLPEHRAIVAGFLVEMIDVTARAADALGRKPPSGSPALDPWNE